jgi:hypothetical protein
VAVVRVADLAVRAEHQNGLSLRGHRREQGKRQGDEGDA